MLSWDVTQVMVEYRDIESFLLSIEHGKGVPKWRFRKKTTTTTTTTTTTNNNNNNNTIIFGWAGPSQPKRNACFGPRQALQWEFLE